LLASIIVEESVLCSSLFIKCFTIDWTRSSVTELIKYLDIVLEWNEDFFKDFTKEFINFLKQDLAIVTAKASKLNSLSPEFQINTNINNKKEGEDENMSNTIPATLTTKHETKSQKNSDSMDIVPEHEDKVSSLSNNTSRDGSQYEYFDSVTISNQNASETSMQVEHEEDHQYTEDAMMVDEDQDESEFQEVQEPYNDNEYGGEESGTENNGATITIKPSYSNDFESCMSNSYASTSVTSINSDYREYQGEDVINSEDEEIIRIDDETGEVIVEEEEVRGDVEEEVIKEEEEDKEKIIVDEEEEVIQEEIICQEEEINDKSREEDHMLRDEEEEEEEEEIIEVEEEIAYTRLDDNEDNNENNESNSTRNKGKEEDITNEEEEEEIPEEIVIEEEEEEGEVKMEGLSETEVKQRLKEEEESNAQLRLEYKKKLKEKEDTINKIKENKKKSQELLSKLVKLYKANLTLTHYKILLADYQLNAAGKFIYIHFLFVYLVIDLLYFIN